MASKPTLIIIHGAPGSGKTYASRWLSQQLSIPLLSKDDIKEELYNHFDYQTVDQSIKIGAASFELLWLWLSKLMPFGQNLLIETAFYAKYNQPKITELAHSHNYQIIQVFCQADEDVRHQRFVDRAHGPDRHPGHMDKQRLADLINQPGQSADQQYQPLDLPGSLFFLDTTDFDKIDYQLLLDQINKELISEN